ncbi:ficolin-1 [Plakobranchus ocellatus]|uniref:Ficolin-1 n=1 Tax=Plakobranchus ocellatus TaxID=259542 RepID=A0AAV4CMM3_9GAST|nr:ficolin-1 [Plakobranchus ocellatus]
MGRLMSQALLFVAMMILNIFAETKDVAESLSDLEKKLAEIVATLNKTDEKHAQLRGQQDLRRTTGDVDFYRDWTSYREGFGSLTGDFWMGNEALYNLTDKDPYELRIDVRMKGGQEVFARYPNFRIEDESNKYRLQIGSYTGTAGDGLKVHNKMFFTTFDRDNDEASGSSCAVIHHGGWWYKNCHHAELNIEWAVTETKTYGWYDGSAHRPVSFSEMKMRRIQLV